VACERQSRPCQETSQEWLAEAHETHVNKKGPWRRGQFPRRQRACIFARPRQFCCYSASDPLLTDPRCRLVHALKCLLASTSLSA